VWNGVLHDTNCDSRSAYVYFELQVYGPGVWEAVNDSRAYTVSTGCGQSASYPAFTIANRLYEPGGDCGSCEHRLQVVLYACNSWTCSSYYSKYYYFFYN